jgi:hypothetical protein
MASFTYYLSDALLQHITNYAAYTSPQPYLGLSSTTPTLSGTNFTEPTGGSYARVACYGNVTWGAASAGVIANAAAVSFAQATASWLSGANITYAGLFDASTSGNLLVFGTVSTPQAVLTGNTPSFSIGGITITLS